MYKFKITQTSILMMVSFKGNSRLYSLGRKNGLTIFFYTFYSLVWKLSSRPQHAGANG